MSKVLEKLIGLLNPLTWLRVGSYLLLFFAAYVAYKSSSTIREVSSPLVQPALEAVRPVAEIIKKRRKETLLRGVERRVKELPKRLLALASGIGSAAKDKLLDGIFHPYVFIFIGALIVYKYKLYEQKK